VRIWFKVADLDAARAFYRDVLGFTVTKQVTISGDWIGKTVGLTNVSAEVVYLDLPSGPRIELLRFIAQVEADHDPVISSDSLIGEYVAMR